MNYLQQSLLDLLVVIEPQQKQDISFYVNQKTIIRQQSMRKIIQKYFYTFSIKQQLYLNYRLNIKTIFLKFSVQSNPNFIVLSNVYATFNKTFLSLGDKSHILNSAPDAIFNYIYVSKGYGYNLLNQNQQFQINGFIYTPKRLFLYSDTEVFFLSQLGKIKIDDFAVFSAQIYLQYVIFIGNNDEYLIIDDDSEVNRLHKVGRQNQKVVYNNNQIQFFDIDDDIYFITSQYYFQVKGDQLKVKDINQKEYGGCQLTQNIQILIDDEIVIKDSHGFYQGSKKELIQQIQNQ
ncbi:hypothetical protein SS50377_20911 [Spironucleus salmonicida]|uniref:Uncharacterized protein n=1 Tax=Spironucleus salmonicida TaxID=348837 RepID=V6LGA0_9EUKA|nr:hypothetical protein SS50377_20911 [Spironucleus salmonicida]|eukprot:EST43585.1 Hypothetical protein SS50377_16626 [Spironucleus salmonicida]